jgi:ATP-dependent Clp protease adaptor protein ClpS
LVNGQGLPLFTPAKSAILPILHRHLPLGQRHNFLTTHPLTMSDTPENPGRGAGNDTSILTKTKAKTQRPPLYKVMLLNDDYTPMEFVVHVLERFFGLTHAQAFDIMLTVHKKGLAVVGVFSHEVAETKVAQVMDFARRHQHPLQCTMEKE